MKLYKKMKLYKNVDITIKLFSTINSKWASDDGKRNLIVK